MVGAVVYPVCRPSMQRPVTATRQPEGVSSREWTLDHLTLVDLGGVVQAHHAARVERESA
jgi:hypothetical protein